MSSRAVNPFGPDADEPETVEVLGTKHLWAKRRERAVWYAVAGVGLMFAGSISTALGIGGAAMALFGIAEYVRWTLKRPKDEDPWRDEDIDAWEEQHYGEDVDAPDVIDEEPEEALGLHNRF